MNIQKLRDMNLHAVADELEQLRAYKEAAEKQEPDCWRITHRSFCGIVTDKKEIAEDPFYSGCVFPLYANPVPAAKPATRQDVIDVLLSTRGQSEGVTADAILGLLSDKGTVAVSASTTDKPADDNGTGNVLWSDSHSEDEILEEHSDNALFDVVANLWADIRCLKEDKPAVEVPDEVRGAIERLDKTQYRVIARRYRAGEGHQSGYTGGNIQINDLTICVEYVRDLLSAAPSHSQQSSDTDRLREFADEIKQLCSDFSDRQNRPYMGDVTSAIDGLYEQFNRCPSHDSEQGK